jgi:phosphopantothenoylcysteine decarboxylase / phosphopantothenate---cysteine ligase
LYCTSHSAVLHFNFKIAVTKRQSPRKQIALAVTGGIAAYKSIEVLRGLQRGGCDVRVTMTRHACEFIQPLTFRALSGSYVIVDDYSSDNPDPIAHITFSQTVDLLIIAPATANTLGKLANGVADDFVTSTYLACTAPVLIAPAMNATMWLHPATQRNVQKLRGDGVHIIEPDAGEMACGTIGPGRLSEPGRIVAMALEILGHSADAEGKSDLSHERVLITAGATREAIDPVRFLSNRSSGKMGFALAKSALARGARVKVVMGATTAEVPANIEVVSVTSAQQMRDAVAQEITEATIFIGAAAVADYRPKAVSDIKLKKSQSEISIQMERTPDILGEVAANKRDGQLIVGFAAETNDVLENARNKLSAKRLDMIVANDISMQGQGFDSENNRVIILRSDADPLELPLMSKLEIADRIFDQIVSLREPNSGTTPSSKKNN